MAINYPQLVEQLVRESGLEITPTSDVCYLEAVKEAMLVDKPDILIMSAFLHGFDMQKCYDVVFTARKNNVRVILLAGSLDKNDPLIYELVRLGVYDILFNPCSLPRIMGLIENPADFDKVSEYFERRNVSRDEISYPLGVGNNNNTCKDEANAEGQGTGGFIGRFKAHIVQKSKPEVNNNNNEMNGFEVSDSTRDVAKKQKKQLAQEQEREFVMDGVSSAIQKEQEEDVSADDEEDNDAKLSVKQSVSSVGPGKNNNEAVTKEPAIPAAMPASQQVNEGAEASFCAQEQECLNNKVQQSHVSVLEQKANISSLKDNAPVVRDKGSLRGKSIVVACWSPISAGKTFVATNLAVAAAKNGASVSLVDLNFDKRSVYTWLNISGQPGSVYSLLSGDGDECACYGKLNVYGAAADFDCVSKLSLPSLNDMLGRIRNKEMVVLDMPSKLTSWHQTLLNECSSVALIADPDCCYYAEVGRCVSEQGNSVLVVNKHVELGGPFNYKDLFGEEPVVKIPLVGDVYHSILFGEPLVVINPDIFKVFNVLYQKIRQGGGAS